MESQVEEGGVGALGVFLQLLKRRVRLPTRILLPRAYDAQKPGFAEGLALRARSLLAEGGKGVREEDGDRVHGRPERESGTDGVAPELKA